MLQPCLAIRPQTCTASLQPPLSVALQVHVLMGRDAVTLVRDSAKVEGADVVGVYSDGARCWSVGFTTSRLSSPVACWAVSSRLTPPGER